MIEDSDITYVLDTYSLYWISTAAAPAIARETFLVCVGFFLNKEQFCTLPSQSANFFLKIARESGKFRARRV